jgi:serine O-acetyltransferase
VHRLRLPLLLGYAVTDQRAKIDADVRRWGRQVEEPRLLGLLRLPAFRSLYYYRLSHGNRRGRRVCRVLRRVARGQVALYLWTPEIGPGLFIQHGFATVVSAKRIGANCWINQQVTIGYNEGGGLPVLEDDVVVYAGAKILGGVHIGRGARIGANAVVVHDVPAGAVAVGVPAVARAPAADPE